MRYGLFIMLLACGDKDVEDTATESDEVVEAEAEEAEEETEDTAVEEVE